MLKPAKLENHLFTTASAESLIFDWNDPKIIENCRAVDGKVNALQEKFQCIQIEDIDEKSIMNYFLQIEPLSNELNDIKKELCDHFNQSIRCKNRYSWLHLDFCIVKYQSPLDFIFKNGLLRWRIGLALEGRNYSDTTLIDKPKFHAFLVQEPSQVQKIIMEFERAKMLLWVLSIRIRSQYSQACDLYKNHASFKEIQAYYHTISE